MSDSSNTSATRLTLAQQIIADHTRWEPDGKMVAVTLTTPEEQAAAPDIRLELQRHVAGFTPDIKKDGNSLTVKTKKNFYDEALRKVTTQIGL